MVGRATFTTVPSMEAMLDPSTVAARTHLPELGDTLDGLFVARMAQRSDERGITEAAPVTRALFVAICE
jgi:hypothetical protein